MALKDMNLVQEVRKLTTESMGKYDNAKLALHDLLKFIKVNGHALGDLFTVDLGSIQDKKDINPFINFDYKHGILNKKQIRELQDLPYRYVYFSNDANYRRINDKNIYNVMNRIVWSMLIGYGQTDF